MQYRPDVDGLRAVAILPVLTFHASLGTPGGFVGVDVFFVISGFLITGLILKDIDSGKFSIFEFWERRIRRILPALTVVVLATLATGWFLFFPRDFEELGLSAVWQATLVANIYFWRDSDYFSPGVDLKPLLHTWSLAVEEQFYLVFPFLLVAISRLSRRLLPLLILLLAFMSFGLSVWGTYTHPSATFYLLPTRAWELLIGALLAAVPPRQIFARWILEAASYAGLAAILLAVFLYSGSTRFPGTAALLPCLGTAVIIWANGCTLTSAGRFLALPPVAFVGLISYSLYLWHWPMLVFSRYCSYSSVEAPLSHRLMILAASFILAAFSWKFIEAPFRKRLVLKTRPRAFAFATGSILLLLGSGVFIYLGQGLPWRFSHEVRQYASGMTDRAFLRSISLGEAMDGKFVELGNGDSNQPIRVVVWGDSHAMSAMPAIDSLCRQYSVRGVGATHSSTAPLIGYESTGRWSLGKDSIPFNSTVLDFIRHNDVSDVILVARWIGYGDKIEVHNCLLATCLQLKEIGARVWIMRTVPAQQWKNVPKALAFTCLLGGSTREMGRPLADHNTQTRSEDVIFAGLEEPGITLLDPTQFFVSPTGICRAELDGHSLYFDNHHLTVHGAMLLRPLFEPVFKWVGEHP